MESLRMSASEASNYEGPRTPRPDERDAVMELSRSIFFPNAAHYLDEAVTWPMALHPEFPENVFAIFHRGEPVSVIARLERDIVIHGHRLRIGYIGGVCTHPDHRGKGLASAIQSASLRLFHEHDVDFVYISGTRPMYYGAGANHTGGFSQFTVSPGSLTETHEVTVRRATKDDIPLLCRLNERDTVRFVRTPVDYDLIVTYGHCAGLRCELRIVELSTVPVAYLAVCCGEKAGKPRLHVVEVRGERLSVLSALGNLADELGEGGLLQVDLPRCDVLGDLLSARGVTGQSGRTSGTVKALDFCEAMTKLKPYFASHLDPDFVRSFQFLDAGNRYVALGSGGVLTIDGESNMLWTLLGAPAGQEMTGVQATGSMAALLERCLPVPLPSVYLNMI